MVHWIDNIAFGVDFRKNRKQKPETLEQVAAQIIDFRKHPEQRPNTLEQMAMQIFDGINLPDMAPCEMIPYLAPEDVSAISPSRQLLPARGLILGMPRSESFFSF